MRPAVEAWLDCGACELPRTDVRSYLDAFLEHVGAPDQAARRRCRRMLEQGAKALTEERWPSEAQIPLATLPYPVLVVSGDHEPAFEAVADVLERALGAERAVVRGAGHAVQNAPGFNETLLAFLRRAA